MVEAESETEIKLHLDLQLRKIKQYSNKYIGYVVQMAHYFSPYNPVREIHIGPLRQPYWLGCANSSLSQKQDGRKQTGQYANLFYLYEARRPTDNFMHVRFEITQFSHRTSGPVVHRNPLILTTQD